MERSRIYSRIYFLLALGRATSRDRRLMIESITAGQMECLQIIAKQIVNGQMPILDRDSDYFNRYARLLRTLKSGWVSFVRKKRLLLLNHTLVPRLLRERYLRHAIRNEIRSPED